MTTTWRKTRREEEDEWCKAKKEGMNCVKHHQKKMTMMMNGIEQKTRDEEDDEQCRAQKEKRRKKR